MYLCLEFEEFGCLRLYLWVEYSPLPSNTQRERWTLEGERDDAINEEV